MRVSMPSLRMTIAGALSTLYLALSSVSSTKLFSTTVTLSLSGGDLVEDLLATSPLSDPPNACVNSTSWTGMVMTERCSLSVASSCADNNPMNQSYWFPVPASRFPPKT
jgi:hypothetical protein